MATDREEPEADEAPPVVKPKLTILVILSMLLGILLTVMAGGGLLYYQQSSALKAELLAARDELKGKGQALDEMKAQIEVLSRQMYALKDYSIAHSTARSDKTRKTEVAEPAGNVKQNPAPPAEVKEAAGAPVLQEPPKVKKPKPKPEGPNCELVGKSAEEQAATLQRCVGMMDAPAKDTPREKTRSR